MTTTTTCTSLKLDVHQLPTDAFPEMCEWCGAAMIEGDWVYQTELDSFCSPKCAAEEAHAALERRVSSDAT